ncbi:CapA family protein [Clostridium sp. D2Q-11]|uniref:CapA family protein n=1 Tax=Anaeromonas frigoriresistens TaxID=2683708 RepID=A0A942UWM8_9FIRM|nr:CapA family protein [Anaeromonas frigoriresistens]MBS4538271.1 CapA family protein [Anaeromonas frigoriresistens]
MKRLITSIFIIIFIVLGVFIGSSFIDNYFDDDIVEDSDNIQDEPKDEEDDIVIEEKPEYSFLSLSATGDIMFHSSQYKAAYDSSTGEYDFKEVFEPVKKHLEQADIAIGNFETTTAGDEYGITSYPSFNSPTSTMEAIKYAGYDILATANNHSVDTGRKGIVNTIDNIKNNDLDYVGTSKDPGVRFLLKEENGIVLSFLSYTYGLNGNESRLTAEELTYMVNLIDEEKIKEDIEKAKNVSDKVVVFIHWGNEYNREPSTFQMELADKMFEWGADVILGSHPHVIQRSEMIKKDGEDKFIIYSMGNFISNQRRETLPSTMNNIYTEDGVIVNIDFKKNLDTEEVIIDKVNYIPTWVHKYSAAGKNEFRILPVPDYVENEELSSVVRDKLRNSYTHTMELMEEVEIVE